MNRSLLKAFWPTVVTNEITMFVLSEASPITNCFNLMDKYGDVTASLLQPIDLTTKSMRCSSHDSESLS